MKKLGHLILVSVAGLFFIGLMALIVVEWAVGCGESYVDAYGKRHYHECLFIDFPKEK